MAVIRTDLHNVGATAVDEPFVRDQRILDDLPVFVEGLLAALGRTVER